MGLAIVQRPHLGAERRIPTDGDPRQLGVRVEKLLAGRLLRLCGLGGFTAEEFHEYLPVELSARLNAALRESVVVETLRTIELLNGRRLEYFREIGVRQVCCTPPPIRHPNPFIERRRVD